MQFYVSIEGKREGPFTLFKMGDLLSEGRIDLDSLAWHRDLEEWKPIRNIPALDSVLPREKEEDPEKELPPVPEKQEKEPDQDLPPGEVIAAEPVLAREVRPFTRFWARMFDYSLVNSIIFLAASPDFIQPRQNESFTDFWVRYMEYQNSEEMAAIAQTYFIAMLSWHFLEGVLIYLFGTTPGKALMGIRISSLDGSRISALKSVGRSFYVYALGMGFYLLPLMLIGMVFGFFRLLGSGTTSWDQHLRIHVETKPLSSGRIMLAIAAFLALLLLLQFLKYS